MTQIRLNLTAVQVRDVKPTLAYGVPASLRLDSGSDMGLLRASMPSGIPANAVVSSASLVVAQRDAWAGSRTLTVRRNAAKFTTGTTFNTKPSLTGTAVDVTQSDTAAGATWSFNVATDVQAFISGTATNYGWRLTTSDATARTVYGSQAPTAQPYLLVEYLVPAEAPTDLHPSGGAVSLAKPTLTFTGDPDMTHLQVQIDAAADEVTPDFDSGEVPATAGVLDLASTAYAGLSNTASTQWRVRVRNPLGLSGWSEWASFSRADFPTLTITAPGATTADGTPPVTWTFAGQVAWQAFLFDAAGKQLATSDPQVGTTQAWTPPKGLTDNGQAGTVEVHAFDAVDREATPGAPAYAVDTQPFTVALSGSVGVMDSLTATQDGTTPGVVLAGVRAAGIPDEVGIYRDGSLVARMPGTEVFTGTAFTWTDYTAAMNHPATWRVAPIVNGNTASGGPTATLTPQCRGIWLIDPDADLQAVLWGDDDDGWGPRDVAVTQTPIGPDAEVSRRRLLRLPRSRTESGPVLDVGDQSAADTILALETFAENDAGHVYRLVLGDLNLPVIVGDIAHGPTPLDGKERIYGAQFTWWARR